MKKDDPYAALGIQWGATTTDIKDAFKEKARALHPDVNKIDSPEEALKKFQNIQKAYSKLMDVKGAPHRDDLLEVSTRMQVIRPQGLEKITDIITSAGMERNGPLLSGAIAI
jgi:curved DNA-binding protein CbpA